MLILSVHDPFHDPVRRFFQTVLCMISQSVHLFAGSPPDLFTFRGAFLLGFLGEIPKLRCSSLRGFLHSRAPFGVCSGGDFLRLLRRFRLLPRRVLLRLLYGKNCLQCHFLETPPVNVKFSDIITIHLFSSISSDNVGKLSYQTLYDSEFSVLTKFGFCVLVKLYFVLAKCVRNYIILYNK